MKIAVVGTGYVGLVTGTCLAETGNDVICVDCDRKKIDVLNRGHIPIYEPGLAELVARNVAAGRLHFTTDLAGRGEKAQLVFLAVGTPPADDGSVDLSALWAVVDQTCAASAATAAIVVCKSTVPVGTNAKVAARLKELTGRDIDVASNPEFLKEGTAIDDFMKPDRVVIGARRAGGARRACGPVSAVSADRQAAAGHVARKRRDDQVRGQRPAGDEDQLHQRDGEHLRARRGRHQRGPPRHRPRQPHRLRLPLSRRRLRRKLLSQGRSRAGRRGPRATASSRACSTPSTRSTSARRTCWPRRSSEHFGGKLADKTIAVWGLAFKPGTDDIREAPALVLIDRLLELEATLRVHDPEAMDNVRAASTATGWSTATGATTRCSGPTPWPSAPSGSSSCIPISSEMRRLMRQPVIFDGRNLYNPQRMQAAGFTYYSIGRPMVRPDDAQPARQPSNGARKTANRTAGEDRRPEMRS